MKSIFAISETTIRVWIRDKTFYSLLILAVILVFCSLFLNELLIGEKNKIINDLGLSVTLFFGVFMTLFTFNPATQDKTLYLVLSKPIPRHHWILGYYLGNVLILLVNTWVLAGMIFFLNSLTAEPWKLEMNWALYLIFIEIILVAALSLFFSTFMSSQALSKFCTLALFFVGHLLEEAKHLLEAGTSESLVSLFTVFYYVFPNLAVFDIKTEAVHQLGIESSHLFYATIYGGAYIAVLLILSSWTFSKTDL
ncbi:ABC transporter permease subunit [Deltaproteobacteria bacterium TL4]